MTIKIEDEYVSDALRKLCERVGGRARTEFIPGKPATAVDVDLEVTAFAATFHPSDLLVHEGRPVFAYIRDHTDRVPPYVPKKCKKVHIAVCDTLFTMKELGRLESRYRVTNSVSNRYLIDIAAGGRKSTEITVDLHPCQNCLTLLAYQGFDATDSSKDRMAIVNAFDAKQAHKDLSRHFETYAKEVSRLRPATLGTGYPKNWRAISLRFRRTKQFTCEECGVYGSRITETHHKDGDKSNVRHNNLQCLCMKCHSKKHSHYEVSEEEMEIIRRQKTPWGRFKRKYFKR